MDDPCYSAEAEQIIENFARAPLSEMFGYMLETADTYDSLVRMCPDLEERIVYKRMGSKDMYDIYYNRVVAVAKRIGKPVAPLWLAWIYDVMENAKGGHAEIIPGKLHLWFSDNFGTRIFGVGLTSALLMSIVAQLHMDELVPSDVIRNITFQPIDETGSYIVLNPGIRRSVLIRVLYVILATPTSRERYSAYGEGTLEEKRQRFEKNRQYQMAVSEQRAKNPGTWTRGNMPSGRVERWRYTMKEQISGDYSRFDAVPGERAVLDAFYRRNNEILKKMASKKGYSDWLDERIKLVHATNVQLERMGSSTHVNRELDIGGNASSTMQDAANTDDPAAIDKIYDENIRKINGNQEYTQEQKESRIRYENFMRERKKEEWNDAHKRVNGEMDDDDFYIGGMYAPKKHYAVATDNTVEIDKKYDAIIRDIENDPTLTRQQKDSRIMYENVMRNDEKQKWGVREHIDGPLDVFRRRRYKPEEPNRRAEARYFPETKRQNELFREIRALEDKGARNRSEYEDDLLDQLRMELQQSRRLTGEPLDIGGEGLFRRKSAAAVNKNEQRYQELLRQWNKRKQELTNEITKARGDSKEVLKLQKQLHSEASNFKARADTLGFTFVGSEEEWME